MEDWLVRVARTHQQTGQDEPLHACADHGSPFLLWSRSSAWPQLRQEAQERRWNRYARQTQRNLLLADSNGHAPTELSARWQLARSVRTSCRDFGPSRSRNDCPPGD
jgi:hypothetical protein